jgi:hypothetical protein
MRITLNKRPIIIASELASIRALRLQVCFGNGRAGLICCGFLVNECARWELFR